jgi:hypothetical protein
MLMRACEGSGASVTLAHQALKSTLHHTLICTTRRATAGPGILQASGKLGVSWLLRRWLQDWFFLLGA